MIDAKTYRSLGPAEPVRNVNYSTHSDITDIMAVSCESIHTSIIPSFSDTFTANNSMPTPTPEEPSITSHNNGSPPFEYISQTQPSYFIIPLINDQYRENIQ